MYNSSDRWPLLGVRTIGVCMWVCWLCIVVGVVVVKYLALGGPIAAARPFLWTHLIQTAKFVFQTAT